MTKMNTVKIVFDNLIDPDTNLPLEVEILATSKYASEYIEAHAKDFASEVKNAK